MGGFCDVLVCVELCHFSTTVKLTEILKKCSVFSRGSNSSVLAPFHAFNQCFIAVVCH